MPQRHRLLPKPLLPKRIRPPAEAAPAETLPAPAEAAPAEFSLFTFRPDSTSPGSEESDWEGPTGRLRSDHQSARTSAEPEGHRWTLSVPDGKGSPVHGRGLARSRTPKRLRGSGYSEACQSELVESRSRGGWARSRCSCGYGAGGYSEACPAQIAEPRFARRMARTRAQAATEQRVT